MSSSFGQCLHALTQGFVSRITNSMSSACRGTASGLCLLSLLLAPQAMAQTIAPVGGYELDIHWGYVYYAQTPINAVNAYIAWSNANGNPHRYTTWCDNGNTGNCYWKDENNVTDSSPFHRISYCPAGYALSGGNCISSGTDPVKNNLGQPKQCTGNPCDPASGNKYEAIVDYHSTDDTLRLVRYYNSNYGASSTGNIVVTTKRLLDLGSKERWQMGFDRTLTVNTNSTGTLSTAMVTRPDGKAFYFTLTNGSWQPDTDIPDTLIQTSTGWTYTYLDGSSETYDTTGRLISESDASTRTTIYSYDTTTGRLSIITGSFGHALTLGYDSKGRLATVTDPTGGTINYTYDDTLQVPQGNLIQIRYQDGTANLYHYENTAFPNNLTGISYVDSAGVVTRYATYAYDTNGKATLTQHAQTDNGSAQEKFTLAYDAPAVGQTTVTDPVGMNKVMTFATNLGVKNLTLKVNQSDSKSVAQTFDVNNNLTCRKDEENRVTLYSYNATNQKTSMTEGLSGSDCNTCLANPANCNVGGVGRLTTYDYLSPTLDLPRFVRRPSVASGQTFETEIQYGDSGHPNLPTQITQRGFTPSNASVARTVTLGYNASGQVNSINGPRTDVSDITTLEYYECSTGGACGQLKKVTNALGHITTYDLYDANGRLLQMTDPNGLRTSYAYDARGRVKTITQTPVSGPAALTQYSYTPWGDVSQVIDPDGVALNYGYDAAHYLRTITDGAGNQIRYAYDLKGNRTQDYIYDPYGYLTRSVAYTYDLRNHPNSSTLANNTTQLVYDAVGNLTQETDPNSHITTHTPDALNRLFRTVDALLGITGYGYDVNDRPTTITAPNNATTQYQYDDLGNRLQEISPDRRKTTYTYDAAGNVLTVTDARTITTTYTYDALNRVVSKQSTDASTASYSYVYDTCFKGRLCNFPGTLLFGYDNLGRLNFQLDLNTFLYSNYVFTSAGRLSHINYPNEVAVDYTYDNVGRVSQISTTTTDGVTTVLAQSFHYYPFGPLNSFSFGNGQYYFENVDQAYRPTFQRNGPRGKNASYDPAGNLAGLNDFNGTAQTFGYDALNELTSADDTQVGSYGSLAYDYLSNGVSNGNRQSETRNGSTNVYTYPNKTNRLAYTDNLYLLYDAAGNTTWSSYAYVMGYDGYGRLTSARSGATTYTYDPLDKRTKKVASGVTTRFAYGPTGKLLYETGGGGKAYVYLNGMPLARIDGANIYYYHTDQLGAPQMMTNSAGATVWKASYEPFGSATVNEDPDGNGIKVTNNLGLPGQYFDAETGLYYNMARYYDPKIGRYITSDPIGLAGGLNTYLYVGANPLRWIDPLGLWSPGGHDALYSNAFIGILDQSEIEIIQQESRALDRSTGVGASTAYIHSMRKPFQSAQAAKAASKKYICDKLKQARGESNRTQALKDFADAAHTITDSLSPEHTGSNGNPRMWFPLWPFGHSLNDNLGDETVYDITPKINEKATAALIDAYNQAFSGNSSNSYCGCQ